MPTQLRVTIGGIVLVAGVVLVFIPLTVLVAVAVVILRRRSGRPRDAA